MRDTSNAVRHSVLGVGVGLKPSDFQALGGPRSERGRRTDETLRFFNEYFENDVMEAHGQKFLFLPRPERPPIYIGGAGDHALRRAVEFADGWMPMLPWWIDRPDTVRPDALAEQTALLREMAEEAGRPRPEVIVGLDFDPKDAQAGRERMGVLHEAAVDGVVTGAPFEDVAEFRRNLEFLREHVLEAS